MATREEIYLAALLHDIGKFWQRADDQDYNNSNVISDYVRNNINNLSNITQDGFATHAHAAYTQQFFENHKNLINKFFKKSGNQDNVTNLAIYHHKPRSFYQSIIQLADWWSSGIDRNRAYETNTAQSDFRERPLISVFSQLYVFLKDKYHEHNDIQYEVNNINLNSLSLIKENIFPTINHNVNNNEYGNLWKKFIEEFKTLEHYGNYRHFVDTLYYLLQRYLYCIPASTLKKDIHDSNLFEHSKTTAAIAISLYDYLNAKNISELKELNNKHRPLQLVCIDISGIQSFIYNISMKGAAKALKGRSFYLQLLIDTVINELLYELDYFRANVLYSSGGKAYLLLPNIQRVNDYLKDYQKRIEQFLFEKFNGNLYITFGKATFYFDKDVNGEKKYLIDNRKDEKGNNKYFFIGDLWKAALEDAVVKKNQKFRSVIENDSNFFEPFGKGGINEICDLTGEELTNDNTYRIDENTFSSSVGEQIELGRILKDVNYFVWTNNENSNIKKYTLYKLNNQLSSLKIHNSYWYFFKDDSKPASVDEAIVYKAALDDFDFLNTIPGKSVKAFRFYAGTTEIKEFGDLLEKGADFSRLAAFVMDVDNLGRLFVDGFKTIYCFWKMLLCSKYNEWINISGQNDLLNRMSSDLRSYKESGIWEKDLTVFCEKYNIQENFIDKINEKYEKLIQNFEDIFNNVFLLTKQDISKSNRNKFTKYFIENLTQRVYDDYSVVLRDNSSFSRLTTLSFYLDLFFSGYVNKIKEKYKDNILIVYSGGDDLLAIGEWQSILSFAEDVRNEFFEFVCKRMDISFSGGISLFSEKFPVSKAIVDAKEAEDRAKKFENQRKGALGLFNEVFSWRKIDQNEFENEFEKVKKIKDNLVKFTKSEIITSSFLQRLQLYYEVKKASEKNGDLSYRWNASYYFKRYAKRVEKKSTSEFIEFMEELLNDLSLFLTRAQIDYFISERNFDLYALAARWAEFEIRSVKKEETKNA